jgi:hypothetical protein
MEPGAVKVLCSARASAGATVPRWTFSAVRHAVTTATRSCRQLSIRVFEYVETLWWLINGMWNDALITTGSGRAVDGIDHNGHLDV